jgi:hypothetical protein
MFYSDTQLFLNFLRILNRLELGVFARAVKLESTCTYIQCVQKVWKHPNKIETNDFREKRKNR